MNKPAPVNYSTIVDRYVTPLEKLLIARNGAEHDLQTSTAQIEAATKSRDAATAALENMDRNMQALREAVEAQGLDFAVIERVAKSRATDLMNSGIIQVDMTETPAPAAPRRRTRKTTGPVYDKDGNLIKRGVGRPKIGDPKPVASTDPQAEVSEAAPPAADPAPAERPRWPALGSQVDIEEAIASAKTRAADAASSQDKAASTPAKTEAETAGKAAEANSGQDAPAADPAESVAEAKAPPAPEPAPEPQAEADGAKVDAAAEPAPEPQAEADGAKVEAAQADADAAPPPVAPRRAKIVDAKPAPTPAPAADGKTQAPVQPDQPAASDDEIREALGLENIPSF